MNSTLPFTFDDYLVRWHLTKDGDPIMTNSSQLLPVIYQCRKAMLKIARSEEEQRGALLMIWWNGEGAARVLEHEGNAILMERATGKRSLYTMAQNNQDDEATQIICGVVAKLHSL